MGRCGVIKSNDKDVSCLLMSPGFLWIFMMDEDLCGGREPGQRHAQCIKASLHHSVTRCGKVCCISTRTGHDDSLLTTAEQLNYEA